MSEPYRSIVGLIIVAVLFVLVIATASIFQEYHDAKYAPEIREAK